MSYNIVFYILDIVCSLYSPAKPRATVEVRNDGGQSLLSIAAQFDFIDLAMFLLTHYKTIDADRWDLNPGM